jgi:hypothetical protein
MMYAAMYDVVPRGRIAPEYWDFRSYELYLEDNPRTIVPLVMEFMDRVAVRVGFVRLPDGLEGAVFMQQVADEYGGEYSCYDGKDSVMFEGSDLREKARQLMQDRCFILD